jgi:hypothetical protein
LSGEIARSTSPIANCGGSGSWTRMPHVSPAVERLDQRQHLVGRGSLREVEAERLDADLVAGADLVAHIETRGRVVADDDDGEAGHDAALAQARHAGLQAAADVGGDCDAIDDLGHRICCSPH